MEHELVQGYQAGHLPGQVDSARRGHPRPGVGVPPSLGQGQQVVGNAPPPVVAEVGGVGRRRSVEGLLHRRGTKGQGEAADVVEQVADAVVLARRRVVQRIVGHSLDEPRHAPGRGPEVDVRGHLWIRRRGEPELIGTTFTRELSTVELARAAQSQPRRRNRTYSPKQHVAMRPRAKG